ncbi:MAG: aldolase catalytic domain-containing protein [Ketobacteraceae bacterium]|nr:aldolase catalytic domain-containing protein [Ketobacteraceae bacterium]
MFVFLDCTLRDGGYYNAWDFPEVLIHAYLDAMPPAGVDVVELGFRSISNDRFRGACAYTTESFLNSLNIPEPLKVGVMVNANELVGETPQQQVLEALFPVHARDSRVSLVRIACHVHEVSSALPAATWLKDKGYKVGFNLMQVADRTENEIKALASEAAQYPVDVLYFADSMGSMTPSQTAQIIHWLRQAWKGPLGIHTHDNMGLALSNTLRAMEEGVTWVDATVTGMGRGPGNARTEELAIEMTEHRGQPSNNVPLMTLLRKHFNPLQTQYNWGTNPYYYLAGKYGIHPTYIQEMLNDSRYNEEDILAVIDHLRREGGKKFNISTLDGARHFYQGPPTGHWDPRDLLQDREVMLLGTGPGVARHRQALESYIRTHKPLVMTLNTQTGIDAKLIDVRIACHPVRLLADCELHAQLPQPLITPLSMLPQDVKQALGDKPVLDFGLSVEPDTFTFGPHYCTVPTSLVVAYALAIIASGQANRALMAGFDGYQADDPRNLEIDQLLSSYNKAPDAKPILAVTPTRYRIPAASIYAL